MGCVEEEAAESDRGEGEPEFAQAAEQDGVRRGKMGMNNSVS